jgi:hypothetical protein
MFPPLASEPSFKLSIAVALSIQRLSSLGLVRRLGNIVAPYSTLDDENSDEAECRKLVMLGLLSSESSNELLDNLDISLLPDFGPGLDEQDARAMSLLLASWLMSRVSHGHDILKAHGVNAEAQSELKLRATMLQG